VTAAENLAAADYDRLSLPAAFRAPVFPRATTWGFFSVLAFSTSPVAIFATKTAPPILFRLQWGLMRVPGTLPKPVKQQAREEVEPSSEP
jgi:hypothetical protein